MDISEKKSEVTFEITKAIPIKQLDLLCVGKVDYVSHGPIARMWFDHHFNKIPVKLNLVFSAENVRAVLNAIVADIGIGVIPKRLLSEGGFKHLHVIETVKKPLINQIMIARQVGRPKSFRETEFIQFFREHAR